MFVLEKEKTQNNQDNTIQHHRSCRCICGGNYGVYFTCPSGKLGLLSSMYTNPAYRRMGIARELLDHVIGEARSYGCGSVHITASDAGVKLYTAYGFKHNENFMMYDL